jgi:hypothetical protein
MKRMICSSAALTEYSPRSRPERYRAPLGGADRAVRNVRVHPVFAQDVLDPGAGLVADASTDLPRCVSSAALAREAQQGVDTCAGEPDLTGKLRRLCRRCVAGENPDSLTLDVAIGLPCLL